MHVLWLLSEMQLRLVKLLAPLKAEQHMPLDDSVENMKLPTRDASITASKDRKAQRLRKFWKRGREKLGN